MESLSLKEVVGTEHLEELWNLFVEHREELTTNKELMILKPDMEAYSQLEDAGMLLSLIAYRGDRAVGYSINLVSKNAHYSDLLMCQNDLLFVTPIERGLTGLKLMRETERLAKERGAQIMLWHAKQNTPLSDLLPRLKYRVQDIIYTRTL